MCILRKKIEIIRGDMPDGNGNEKVKRSFWSGKLIVRNCVFWDMLWEDPSGNCEYLGGVKGAYTCGELVARVNNSVDQPVLCGVI